MIKHKKGKRCPACDTDQTLFASENTCVKWDFAQDVTDSAQARKEAVPKKPLVAKTKRKKPTKVEGPTHREIAAQQIIEDEKL